MSSPNDPSLWQWIAGSIASIGGGLFGYHKYIDTRLSRKADREDVMEIKQELAGQRRHLDRIESKNEERHRELLMHLLERKER